MKKHIYIIILSILILSGSFIFAEETRTSPDNYDIFQTERDQRTILAMTNPDYPVTPGDIYSVSYIQAGSIVNINCVVSSDYTVNLGFFGEISGRNKNFSNFKADILNKITWAFPESYPNVNITSTGIFEIYLTGEVKRSKRITAWGLTRLSDIVSANSTGFTSFREIEVSDSNGKKIFYDLYKAWYDGDISQDPLISPGSTIKFKQYSRTVSINGEIKRAGRYQLLDGDNLSTLIEYYANNFTETAYKNNIIIYRSTGNSQSGDDTSYIDYEASPETELLNLDEVTVRSKELFLPIFYIEGAVNLGNGSDLKASNIVPLNFKTNTRLSTLLIAHKNFFSNISDLENSYYIRASDNKIIDINLARIIYDYDLTEDIIIKSGDRLIVPLAQLFVTVNGAVITPGRYPYVPNKDFHYYINLAGGFDTMRNSGDRVRIYDDKNHKHDSDRVIEKEDIITAETNRISYAIKEYSPLITAISATATIIATLVTIFK